MNEEANQLESYWGCVLNNSYTKRGSNILAVILPGEGYTNDKPLMYYANKIAVELGLDVLCIDYGFQVSNKNFNFETEFDVVLRESLLTLRKALENNYKKIIFIGKSLGTIIQNELSKELIGYEQAHLYLTPVDRTFKSAVNYPCLVITGTKDTKINNLTINVLEKSNNIEVVKIDEGNHRLECVDTLKSIKMLNTIIEALKKFVIVHCKG